MDWKTRWLLLVLSGIPAFTGLPELPWQWTGLPGIDPLQVLYTAGLYGLIAVLCGPGFLAGLVSAASMIVIPLVFAGAGVSYLLHLSGLAYPEGPFAYSPHYVSLALNVLCVIPLALSLVLNIPFSRIELGLLCRSNGVSRREKELLMVLRVFNHIAFSVIPAALEVVREERWGVRAGVEDRRRPPEVGDAGHTGAVPGVRAVVSDLVHLASTCICSALRYIPLWAMEIARLPERSRAKRKGNTS
ncbi:MAG: hypothetical protein ACOWWM_07200 [Desulfobacterales bacterium]